MSTKTHYTTAGTFTVPSLIEHIRAVVAGGGGDPASYTNSWIAGDGAVLSATIPVSPADTFAVSFRTGGAYGSAASTHGGKGGDAALFADIVAAGGGGVGSGNGGDGGAPSVDGGAGPKGAGSAAPGGGKADGSGGAGGVNGSPAGSAGQSNASGGKGGAGASTASEVFPAGGGGAGFGGGGGGGLAQSGAGGSSSAGSYGATLSGYNDNYAYVDVFVAGAPKAPTPLSPTGNVWQDGTKPITLSVTHNPDTPGDPLDAQTDCRFRYRKVESPAGAWTDVATVGTATSTAIAANTLPAGQIEWQSATKADGTAGNDATGKWGAWTDSQYFRVGTPPSPPTQTAPAANDTIAVAVLTSSWTAPGQVEYQTQLVGDTAGVADESVIYSSKAGTTALTDTLAAPVNDVDAHVRTRIRTTVGGLWSDWTDTKVSVAWLPPPVAVAYQRPNPERASITMKIANPTPTGSEPTPDEVRVYITENGVEQRRAILAPDTDWEYRNPIGNVGLRVESVYTPTGVASTTEVIW